MTDDELLTPKSPATNDELKAALLARTTGQIRFDRRLRLVGRIGICVACFVAGLGVAFLRPSPEPRVVYVQMPTPPVADAPGSPKKDTGSPPAVARVLSPAELELEAEKTLVKAEAARRFREAGDVTATTPIPRRLRCYRNFSTGDGRSEITAEDTWLLASLNAPANRSPLNDRRRFASLTALEASLLVHSSPGAQLPRRMPQPRRAGEAGPGQPGSTLEALRTVPTLR